MILIDRRKGSADLLPLIKRIGLSSQLDTLPAGDASFEGNGPSGTVLIGIERKKLRDILACINDGRYAGFQQHGMAELYSIRFIIVEGIWKPSEEGDLLEYSLRKNSKGEWKWGWYTMEPPVMYDKLFRFMVSATFTGGTHWLRSGSPFETAWQIVSLYHWWNKKWDNHRSMAAIQEMNIPQFTRPSFEQEVASRIVGIGVARSLEAARIFKTLPAMVRATALDWQQIDGIGPGTARKIVKQIHKMEL